MAVNFHEFSALPLAPGAVPIEFSPTPAPLSFAALLGDMWRSIYPLGDPPHYQVFQFSAGGRIQEYVAHVHLSARFLSVSAPVVSTVVTALLPSVPFSLPQWQESPVFVIKRAWCKRTVLINIIPPSSRILGGSNFPPSTLKMTRLSSPCPVT